MQYSSALTGLPVLSGPGGGAAGGLLDCANQHLKPVSAFGHQLLVPPTLACALGQGLAGLQGLPVFDNNGVPANGGGNLNLNATAGFPVNLQLPPATAAELSQMGFVSQDQQQRIMQQQQQQLPVQQQQLHDKVQCGISVIKVGFSLLSVVYELVGFF